MLMRSDALPWPLHIQVNNGLRFLSALFLLYCAAPTYSHTHITVSSFYELRVIKQLWSIRFTPRQSPPPSTVGCHDY